MSTTKKLEKDINTLYGWMHDSKSWVLAYFRNNLKKNAKSFGYEIDTDTGLTKQQEHALGELSKLIRVKLKIHRKEKLTKDEEPYKNKIGISIMSGHFSGKDFWLAVAIWYFLECFYECKIICTANTENQLKNVLLSELSKVQKLSLRINEFDETDQTTILQHQFKMQSDKIYKKGIENEGKTWFCEFVTARENASPEAQAETLAGRNAPYKLVVVDEATGVPDPVFRPLEGGLGGIVNICLLVFNPTKTKGYAIRSQYQDSDRWINLRWNAEDSEIVNREHIKFMADKYGKDSNPYRIRVLGLPPKTDSNTLIPYEWIEAAIDRPLEISEDDPVIKGFDIGAGGDKSVIATRKGGKVYPLKRKNTKNSTELYDWVRFDFIADATDRLFGDVISYGWSILGDLKKEFSYKIRPIDVRNAVDNFDSAHNKQFSNIRTKMYFNLRDVFQNNAISIPNDEELINQLSVMRADYSGKKITVSSKNDIKKEIGHSNDEADAVALMYADLTAVEAARKIQHDDYDEDAPEHSKKNTLSWMGV